ncbi:MAG: TatD family hydrolase [Acidimicrobiales bacterium]
MTPAPMDPSDPVPHAVIEWFDSHCHLQSEYLADGKDAGGKGDSRSGAAGRDREETGTGPCDTRLAAVIVRASGAGITRMVCVGTDAATSKEAVDLARTMTRADSVATAEGVRMWATVGLHPHDAVDGVDTLGALLRAEVGGSDATAPGGGMSAPLVVAIGECGLDYHYDHSPRDIQRAAFAAQIELAILHRLALVIHTREAWDDTIDILASVGVPERTVVHCFTGGPEEARRCLDLGASLSFSGVVTFKTAADVRDAAELCPIDRILVETDSPFLTPAPHRGAPNEPARVALVGAAIAAVKGVSRAAVAEASTANANAVFGL